MLFFDGGLALLLFGVWLFCVIDVITTPEGACRNLPKLAWVFIVILLADLGALAWLVAGRPWATAAAASTPSMPRSGNGGSRYPKHDRPGRPVATNPDDDEEFLASLRARAEEQRRRAREAKRLEDEGTGDGESSGPADT